MLRRLFPACSILSGVAMALLFAAVQPVTGCGGRGYQGDVVCDDQAPGDTCVCPSSEDCSVDCRYEVCDLTCESSGDCDFVCGAGCKASCRGSGECLVDVGPASKVKCSGSGGCDVACHGDCTVECSGSGKCTAWCDEGYACAITKCKKPRTCADGVKVCNGSCP